MAGPYHAEHFGLTPSADRFTSLEAALGYCEMREGDALVWFVLDGDPRCMRVVGYEYDGAETPRAYVRGPVVAVWPEQFKQEQSQAEHARSRVVALASVVTLSERTEEVMHS